MRKLEASSRAYIFVQNCQNPNSTQPQHNKISTSIVVGFYTKKTLSTNPPHGNSMALWVSFELLLITTISPIWTATNLFFFTKMHSKCKGNGHDFGPWLVLTLTFAKLRSSSVQYQGCIKYLLSGIQSFSWRICLTKRGFVYIRKCNKKAYKPEWFMNIVKTPT